MKIRTSLFFLSASFVILIIAIGFVMFRTFDQIDRELVHYNDINEMANDMSKLSIVTHEYFMHHEKRMLEQWLLKYDSVGRILESVSEEDIHPGHFLMLKSIALDYKALGDLFSQLQANLAKRKRLIKENRPQREIDVTYFLEEREMAHVLMAIQRITTGVLKFSAITHKSVKGVQQRANQIVLFSIIGFAILSTTVSFLVIGAITGPLNKLIKSTEIIGKGDLQHKVDIRAKNELGEFIAFRLLKISRGSIDFLPTIIAR